MGSRFLDNYPYVVEYLLKILPEGMTFYATNMAIVTFKAPSTNAPGVRVGEPFVRTGPSGTAITTEELVTMEIDESYYGESIKVFAAPLYDDDEPDKLIGAYAMSIPRDSAFMLRRIANTYQVGMSEIEVAIKKIAAASREIEIKDRDLQDQIIEMQAAIQQVNSVCGDSGSEEAPLCLATDIIQDKIDKVREDFEAILARSEEQARALAQVTARVEQLTGMLADLRRIAHDI